MPDPVATFLAAADAIQASAPTSRAVLEPIFGKVTELRAKHISWPTIAKMLADSGFVRPNGKPFKPSSLSQAFARMTETSGEDHGNR